MDESVFANEIFTPNYSNYFYGLNPEKKAQLVKQQTLASDGISQSLLQAIYQRLYALEFFEQKKPFVQFVPNHKLVEMTADASAFQLLLNEQATTRMVAADIVVLATGFAWKFPEYLSSLSDKIALENGQFQGKSGLLHRMGWPSAKSYLCAKRNQTFPWRSRS